MAALAFTRWSSEFRVDTVGWSSPVGQMLRNPSCASGTTVTFSEYAVAVLGILQPPSCGTGKSWKVPPRMGALLFRVSASRHGGTATNCTGDVNSPVTE